MYLLSTLQLLSLLLFLYNSILHYDLCSVEQDLDAWEDKDFQLVDGTAGFKQRHDFRAQFQHWAILPPPTR